MSRPYVTMDLGKIEHNARTIAALCAAHGITLTAVTKGTCGHPDVARAMLTGGATSIGESRMENVQRLREAGIEAPILLLRNGPAAPGSRTSAPNGGKTAFRAARPYQPPGSLPRDQGLEPFAHQGRLLLHTGEGSGLLQQLVINVQRGSHGLSISDWTSEFNAV